VFGGGGGAMGRCLFVFLNFGQKISIASKLWASRGHILKHNFSFARGAGRKKRKRKLNRIKSLSISQVYCCFFWLRMITSCITLLDMVRVQIYLLYYILIEFST
jgi:hypothetical protein